MPKSRKEKPIQAEVMADLGGRPDTRVFRNNSGLAVYPDGSHVRYCVGQPGGADLIGWHSVIVTQAMLGRRMALFLAVETKRPGKDAKGPQANFLSQVKKAGGLAGVARSISEARKILDLNFGFDYFKD